MAPTQATAPEQLESAQHLRSLFGRITRLLRPTETGSAKQLTPTRTSVLLAADRHGPIRLAEIADREGLNPTQLSRTVAKLVEAGLLQRTADTSDRRSAWITTTDLGGTTAAGIRLDRTAHVHCALERLSAEDRDAILSALPALENLVESLRNADDHDRLTGLRQ